MSKQCTSAVPRDFPDDHLHHVPDHESRRYPAVQGAQLWHLGAHLWLQLPHGAVLADVLLRPAEPCHLPPAVPSGRKAVNGHIKSVLQLYRGSITAAFGAASQPVRLYKFDIPDIQMVNNVPILPRF